MDPVHLESRDQSSTLTIYGGQFVLVAPAFDIVVVFKGGQIQGRTEESAYRAIQERILPAIR